MCSILFCDLTIIITFLWSVSCELDRIMIQVQNESRVCINYFMNICTTCTCRLEQRFLGVSPSFLLLGDLGYDNPVTVYTTVCGLLLLVGDEKMLDILNYCQVPSVILCVSWTIA